MTKKSAPPPTKRPNPNKNNPNDGIPSKTPKSNQASSAGSNPVRIIKTISPEKFHRDPNEYRVITLSNNLKIVLISRKESLGSGNIPAAGTSSSAVYTVAKKPSAIIQPFQWSWPSLQHHAETPAFHFIDPRLTLSHHHEAPICQFISTPPATTGMTGCRSDEDGIVFGNPFDDVKSVNLNSGSNNPCNSTSVAVVVNAGGLNDLENCEGLHHFTEHMVHYGSVRFPDVDAVNCIVANFGKYNATTFPHTTCYYNEVPDLVLERNLERFSDMLAQPIFNAEVMKKEVHAVDNEFYLRLPPFRKMLLQSHVMIKSKSHPQARFFCGTLKTLKGGNIQDEMKNNHKTNYVASAMTVSLNSTKSLDVLQELALRHFSNFVEGDRTTLVNTPEDLTLEPLIFHESKTVYLQGLTSVSELTFVWPLPTTAVWMKNSVEEPVIPVIVRLLSDSNTGGLSHFLRSKEYIWLMVAYKSPMSSRYTTILEITFFLTEKGRQNAKAIEHATFEYIRFLQKASKEHLDRLFLEMKIINLKQFNYGSQSLTSWENTQGFAMLLQLENNDKKLLLSQSWAETKLNFASFQEALKDLLTADKFAVIQTVPRTASLKDLIPNATVKIAPHTNAEYVEAPRGGDNPEKPLPPQTFGFVAQNSFLSPDYDLMSQHGKVGSGDSYALKCPDNFGEIKPQGLMYQSRCDTRKGNVFPKISGAHHGHQTYGHDTFSGSILVRFVSPILLNTSAQTTALIWLWTYVTTQKLSPYTSEWEAAGFSVNIQPVHGLDTIAIYVTGFPRDIEHVVETVVEAMMLADGNQKVGSKLLSTELAFNLAKHHSQYGWEHLFSENENITEYLVECCIYDNPEMSSVDILGVMDAITLEDLQMFMANFKKSCFSFVNLTGNLPIQIFKEVASLLDRMPYEPLWENDPTYYSAVYKPLNPSLLVPGETCVKVKNMASYAYTTQVTNVYTLGPCVNKDADLFGAAMNFMNCQAFMDLRTRQQLGYSVYVRRLSQPRAKLQMIMFSVSITATASKHTACELNQRIDQFLEDYKSYLEKMPEELFQTRLKLACTPFPAVKKADVAAWFRKKIPANFGNPDVKWKCLTAGIKKQSIQVISGNPDAKIKECTCTHCANIAEWKQGSSEGSKLSFARGRGFYEQYYVPSHKF